MKTLEKQIKEYKSRRSLAEPKEREDKVKQAVIISKQAFYEREQENMLSGFEFLFQQASYIKKKWWFYQFIILVILWRILSMAGISLYLRRSMGVLAPVFVIMLIPELWKNRSCCSMEIESAAYFSLRQIYAARLFLFAMIDGLLLSLFFTAITFTASLTIGEIMIQFFLPFNVACCICFRTLCSKRLNSEYFAVVLCILFIAIWIPIIMKDSVYDSISGSAWAAMLACSLMYLCYSIYKVLKNCENYPEVDPLWN